jgi:hypothetical protein
MHIRLSLESRQTINRSCGFVRTFIDLQLRSDKMIESLIVIKLYRLLVSQCYWEA